MYYQRNSFFGSFPPVTRNLLIINVIIFIGCWLIQGLEYKLALFNIGSGYFNPYQLITYMFTHADFNHLFFNMFALFMFGASVETFWGQKRFLTYYLTTGIGAGIVQLISLYCAGITLPVPTIGASGSVFGLLLAFGMLFPNTPLYLMFIPIPIKAKYMVIGYGLIEFWFGVANRSGDNVAHFAHLGGMLFGILLILYWRKRNYGYYGGGIFTGIKNSWNSLKNKLFPKEHSELRNKPDWDYNARRAADAREIDAILDKIKHSGYNSLNDEEKRKLFEAGRK